jgi:hypothetical protein
MAGRAMLCFAIYPWQDCSKVMLLSSAASAAITSAISINQSSARRFVRLVRYTHNAT